MATPKFDKLDDLMSFYVDSGRLAGVVAAVCTDQEIIFSKVCGLQDRDTRTAMAWDSIFRIYSMTKPITSIAAMMLWEDGKFALDDPVAKHLPSFGQTMVIAPDGIVKPALQQMTVRHLLCHTAGMTLPAFSDDHLVGLYRENDLDGLRSRGSLAGIVDRLGSLPVMFEPGSRWSYSMATDVVGRLVEIWSGQPFETFLKRRIFNPLEMTETSFHVAPKNVSRLTTSYSVADGVLGSAIDRGATSSYLSPPEFVSGSGGLVSTAADYLQLLRMLINGGSLLGKRILKTDTLALMTQNHLGGDMAEMGAADFNGSTWHGIGFGLGFSVVVEPSRAGFPELAQDYGWTGAAGTMFFVNSKLKFAALLLTQYMPSRAYSLRSEFRKAFYAGFQP